MGWWFAAVPWARPRSRFTAAFEDTCAWLVCHATLSVFLIVVAWSVLPVRRSWAASPRRTSSRAL